MRRAKRIGGSFFGRLIVAHGDADDVTTGAQVLRVPAHVVGVLADYRLEPSHNGACRTVRFAADVDPGKTLVTVKHVAAVGSEPGLLQALAGIFERRVVGEDPYDTSTRIREGVRWVRAAGQDVSLRSGVAGQRSRA